MKAHSPTHGLTAQLERLAAKPPTAKRDAAMLKLQKRIRSSEGRVSPRIVHLPDDVLPSEQEERIDGPSDIQSIERILVSEVHLPFLRWLLDADGRGALNMQAMHLRVVEYAWLIGLQVPGLTDGSSLRKLSGAVGVSHATLARGVRTVSEQLGLGHHTLGSLKKASGRFAAKFTAATKRRRAAA